MAKKRNAAPIDHYVPKHILRNFLSNPAKEQVTVFDKQTLKVFTPNINGIMGERRYHGFVIDDQWVATYEPSICKMEDQVLPVYNDVVANRRLTGSPEERTLLAFLIAFQFSRTKAFRNSMKALDDMLKSKIGTKGKLAEELLRDADNPDALKVRHADFMSKSLQTFTEIIARKQLILMEPPPGRSFYLGDNPVGLHNSEPSSRDYGNIGLDVPGIEIYLPLAHDLTLAAWCPSILEGRRRYMDEVVKGYKQTLVGWVMSGKLAAGQMKELIEPHTLATQQIADMIKAHDTGLPVAVDDDHVDFQNNLQMIFSVRHVVCKQGNFEVAEQFMKDNPGHEAKLIQSMA